MQVNIRVEDKQKRDSDPAERCVHPGVDTSKDSHRRCLACCTKQHQITATKTLDGPDSYEGGQEILCAIKSCEETGEIGTESNVLVDLSGVVLKYVSIIAE